MFYRNKRKLFSLPVIIGFFIAIALWQQPQLKEKEPIFIKSALASEINEPLQPISLNIGLNEEKVKLGEKLFNEPQLSHNNSISCASCHFLTKGGTDNYYQS